ncbi:hypothetical protein SO802_029805 [Lithocarpus litseifolius]|uniref:RNase H type-1 domain-containing protein n=1 Tax=Lithocarpus litseifolius TaxID=425828 RepID=A0AAW2BUA7_9ROSI
MIEDYKDVNGLKAKHKVNKKQQWEPPPEGFYTINVDSAIPSTNGQSEVGMLIRDWNRRVIAAVSMPLPGRYSVEEIEAIAVEQGLVLAKELGLEKIIVEGNSLLTIQAVETMDVKGFASHIIKDLAFIEFETDEENSLTVLLAVGVFCLSGFAC